MDNYTRFKTILIAWLSTIKQEFKELEESKLNTITITLMDFLVTIERY